MQAKTTIELFSYWSALRGDNDAPHRRDINPAAIPHILPELFILEAQIKESPVFRLAGTKLCAFFARELRGSDLSGLWSPTCRVEVTHAAIKAMHRRMPRLVSLKAACRSQPPLDMEMLLLPLRSQADVCDRIFGCLTPVAPLARDWSINLEHLDMTRIAVPLLSNNQQVALHHDDGPAASRYAAIERKILKLFQGVGRLCQPERA